MRQVRDMWTTEQIAERWGLTRRRVQQIARKRKIMPDMTIGGANLYTPETVNEMIPDVTMRRGRDADRPKPKPVPYSATPRSRASNSLTTRRTATSQT